MRGTLEKTADHCKDNCACRSGKTTKHFPAKNVEIVRLFLKKNAMMMVVVVVVAVVPLASATEQDWRADRHIISFKLPTLLTR